MTDSDLTLEILRGIRAAADRTNAQLEQTNVRLDHLATRVDHGFEVFDKRFGVVERTQSGEPSEASYTNEPLEEARRLLDESRAILESLDVH